MNHPQPQQGHKKTGIVMLVIAWGILLVLVGVFFDDLLSQQQNPNQAPVSAFSSTGMKEVRLLPNRQHHYVLSGFINDVGVEFLLDTGATDVVIPQGLAKEIGLVAGRKSYASTANGTITVFRTTLDTVNLGNIQLTDISASINPAMHGNVVLLGMSALKQIEFSQRGDTLILRQ
jgi:aspartyl protease family protein